MDDNAITSDQVRRDKSKYDAENVFSEEQTLDTLISETLDEIREERINVIMRDTDGLVLVKMERQNSSWATRSGVVFTREHPFQLVTKEEADELFMETGFREAGPEEVLAYYKGEI